MPLRWPHEVNARSTAEVSTGVLQPLKPIRKGVAFNMLTCWMLRTRLLAQVTEASCMYA